MNKNTILGIVLIGAILIGFAIYTSKEQKQQQEVRQKEAHIQDSIYRATPRDTVAAQPVATITATQPVIDTSYGLNLMAATQGEQQLSTLENKFLKIAFTNKGGRIYSVQVKNFYAYDSLPVVLFDGDKNDFSLNFFFTDKYKLISTSSFFFTPVGVPTATIVTETDSVATLTYRLQVEKNAYVDYIYTLGYNSHSVGLQMKMNGMNVYIPKNVTTLDLTWTSNALRQEKDFKSEANYSTVAYKSPSENSIDELGERKEAADKKITTRVEWVAFKQQFFSSILRAKNNFNNATVAYQNNNEGNFDRQLMHCSALMQLPYDNTQETNIGLEFYFGPNHYKTLKLYDHNFEKLVPLGGSFISPINRWLIIPIFDFLSKFISNFGLIILLLTIFIKLILSPFSQKSIVSSAKMKLLKPEIDKISEKYPKQEDALKKQQETMALYKKTGVSMMGGCLPMLLQMPILFAMFRFFPASFELRQESFLWAKDLSSYDSIFQLPFTIPFYGDHVSLFALLMAVSTFFYSKMMLNQTPQTGQPGMKFMQVYFMPIFLLVLCNNFSSGLSYYYMLSNVFTMLQTWVIRRFFIDEEKLHAKMKARAAAAPTKKKSKFQLMLENAQKAQNQQKKK